MQSWIKNYIYREPLLWKKNHSNPCSQFFKGDYNQCGTETFCRQGKTNVMTSKKEPALKMQKGEVRKVLRKPSMKKNMKQNNFFNFKIHSGYFRFLLCSDIWRFPWLFWAWFGHRIKNFDECKHSPSICFVVKTSVIITVLGKKLLFII